MLIQYLNTNNEHTQMQTSNYITRSHTRTHAHMQSPHGYYMCHMQATKQTNRKITRVHTHVYTNMQSPRSYLTHLMHAIMQIK